MIDKTNIPLENKLSKRISYTMFLNSGKWLKTEYNSRGNITYYENSGGYWYKYKYDSIGKQIYFENSNGYIKDDRKN